MKYLHPEEEDDVRIRRPCCKECWIGQGSVRRCHSAQLPEPIVVVMFNLKSAH
jgi:hypothetical protein